MWKGRELEDGRSTTLANHKSKQVNGALETPGGLGKIFEVTLEGLISVTMLHFNKHPSVLPKEK